LPISSITNFH